MALNNEFKVKNDLNTLGRILSGGTDLTTIFSPSNTSWTLSTTNGNFAVAGGDTLSVQGGNGVDVRVAAGTDTVRVSGVDATTSVKGVASFNSDDFTVTGGAVTIKTGGVDNNQLKTASSSNLANNVVVRGASGEFSAGSITVTGNVSASNIVYGSGGNSQQWNSAYSTVLNVSGNWVSTYTTVQNNSANWETAYNTATTYQQTSGGFALSGYNTTISDSVSSVLVGGASPLPASEWKTKSIIQVLDTILFPDLTASYTSPTISIAMSPTTTQYEVGSLINITFTGSFTRNDAGGLSAIRVQRSPLNTSSFITLSTTTNPVSAQTTNVPDQFGYTNPNNPTLNSNSSYSQAYVDTAYTVIDGITYWRVTGDYRSGLPKPNNKGVTDTRPFAVRSTFNPQLSNLSFASSNTTITGRRKLFYSNDTGTSAPTNSTQVRALTGVIGSGSTWPANGTTFNISINPGTKRIVIAYPTSFGVISEIKNGLGFNVTGDFVESTVSVDGANSTLPTDYYVYTYIAAGTFGSPETYSVIV